jgi:Ca2+-binding EF-hand superfamily protein
MKLAALFCLCLLPPADTAGTTPGSLLFEIQGKQPELLELEFELEGKPLGTVWKAALADLFADLDRNSDGTLDRNEAKRVPEALRLRQLGWNYLFAVPRAAAWDELDADRNGKVTQAELVDYYQRHGLGKPLVGVGQFAPTSKINEALLKRIAGASKRPDRAAWLQADKTLAALDIDSDEMIRPDEILAHTLYPGSFGGTALPAPGSTISQPKLIRDLPVRLLSPGNGKGSRNTQPIRRRIVVSKTGDIEVTVDKQTPGHDRHFIQLPDVHLAIFGVPGRLPETWIQARDVALQRFQQADANQRGFVDLPAAGKVNFAPLRDHLTFADRDRDGKLTRAEWETYLRLRTALIACMIQITVLDSGPSLFEALDLDADGALSVRELRNARQRLESLGCTTNEGIDPQKLPRRIRFILSLGQPRTLTRRVLRSGPAWFLSMDRNNDGDISRQEFLGDDPTFRKLDLNNDGLISREEAEKSEAK